MEKVVILSKENSIASIILNRPKSLNSMNDELVQDLTEALLDAGKDNNIKVIILRGNGKGFCAGGDLNFLQSLTNQIVTRKFAKDVGNLVKIIMETEKPVIGMINGVAAGAGFNLAMACDILYCSESAKFSQSFSKVGLIPDCGGFYLLPRIVGVQKAKELMFSAALIDSKTALELGIVSKVVNDDQLEEAVYQYAEGLAKGAPIALGMIKMLVNRSIEMDLDSTLEAEADLQSICIHTEDHKEGVKAFLEKRQPVFTGN